ncbi:MAG: dephospho-CoA kinase [Dehalococcoidia bacterium]
MTVIGLTGGIASGKSTAAEMLREMGASVIDADRLGHRSYDPGTPGFEKVVNAFGHDIVGKDGLVDRRVLGGKVFGAPGQMERLNSIVWPEIRNLIKDEIKQIRSQDSGAIIVLEAAVLLEAQWQDLCDEIWVVTTPVKTAVARLRSRNGLSEDAAMARINSQMTNKERLEHAKVKIENVGTEEQLRAKIERPWRALESRMGRSRPARKAAPAKPAKTTKSARSAAAKKNSSRTAPKASAKAAAKPARTAPAKPAAKASATKPAKPAATKVVKKAAAKSAGKPASKSAVKPATKSAAAAAKEPAKKAATRAATTAVAKPAAKSPSRKAAAASKAARPTTKTTARSAAKMTKAVAKPAAKTTKPAAKPAARKTATRSSTRATSGAGSSGRGASRAGARSK